MSKKILGIYHSKDLDGLCCGAIIKYNYPDCDLYGYDRPDSIEELLNFIDHHKYDLVIMADISIPMEHMEHISKNSEFIWIDHHKSAMDEYDLYKKSNKSFNIKTHTRVGISACRLTYEFFYPYSKNEPRTIKLLGLYDVWDKTDVKYHWDSHVVPFQYYMRSIITKPEDIIPFFDGIELFSLSGSIAIGKAIINYNSVNNKKLVSNNYSEFKLFSRRVIAVNNLESGSLQFESIYKSDKHDIMLSYYYNAKLKKFFCSMYSDKEDFDCSLIAVKFGGGGHKNACGFSVDREVMFNILYSCYGEDELH